MSFELSLLGEQTRASCVSRTAGWVGRGQSSAHHTPGERSSGPRACSPGFRMLQAPPLLLQPPLGRAWGHPTPPSAACLPGGDHEAPMFTVAGTVTSQVTLAPAVPYPLHKSQAAKRDDPRLLQMPYKSFSSVWDGSMSKVVREHRKHHHCQDLASTSPGVKAGRPQHLSAHRCPVTQGPCVTPAPMGRSLRSLLLRNSTSRLSWPAGSFSASCYSFLGLPESSWGSDNILGYTDLM